MSTLHDEAQPPAPTDQKVETDADVDVEASDAAKERRKIVEARMKRKLDLRCSIFVVIYIMSPSLLRAH
jgi:hypothetical protein